MAESRIIDLTEKQSLESGDYFIVDNETGGTKKIKFENFPLNTDNIKTIDGYEKLFDINHTRPVYTQYISIEDGVMTIKAPISDGISPLYAINNSDLQDNNYMGHIHLHVLEINGIWRLFYKFKTNGGVGIRSTIIENIDSSGDYYADIDLTSLTIYHDYDGNGVQVMLYNISQSTAEEDKIIVVDAFDTYIGFSNSLEGDTLTETLVNIDTKVKALYSNGELSLMSADGEKYVIQLNSNGQIVTIPTLASNILYIGNSLLLGFTTHGMASTTINDDYYAKINAYLESKGKTLTTDKVSGAPFEQAEDSSAVQSYLNNVLSNKMSNSLELVIIQLGDNINSPIRRELFKTSCETLIKYIRANSTNARIVWIGTWYSSALDETINLASQQYGFIHVSIHDLSLIEGNMNHVGATYIDENGNEQTITNVGVANHPSDAGFTAIANRVIETIFK